MAVRGDVTRIDGAVGLRLANLLAARLCHDLSGPLGGLGMALGEVAGDPAALALAQDAAMVLRQRLALSRAAWGEGTAPLPRATLRDLACGLPNAARLQVELDALADDPPFAPPAARVVASTLLLAAASLPAGGLLALAGNPGGKVLVTIGGPRAAWPVGLGAMLASPQVAWEAVAGLVAGPDGLRALPAPLLALLADAAGVRASLLLAGQPEQTPPLLLDFSAPTRA
jgi:histidine phosphotransferase ChpT